MAGTAPCARVSRFTSKVAASVTPQDMSDVRALADWPASTASNTACDQHQTLSKTSTKQSSVYQTHGLIHLKNNGQQDIN